MAQQFCLDLKQIPDEDTAKMAADVLLQSLVVDNVLKKQIGRDFFNKCLRNFQDERASPQLKFNTLSIFRCIDLKNKSSLKVFSILTGHPIYTYLIDQAKTVDPRKSMNEKGKNLFTKNKEIGVKYMRLLLESIKFWSEKFPTTSQKQPTKYRKMYMSLVQQKVVFPETFTFYSINPANQQKQQKQTPGMNPNKYARQPNPSQNQTSKVQTKGATQVPNSQQQKVTKGSIMLLFNKIQSFVDFLQQSESVEQLQRQITKNHKMFQKQQKRLQNSNVLTIEDDKIVSLYLKINEFFLEEFKINDEWFVKKDSLKMYIDNLLLKYEVIFAEELVEDGRPSEKSQKPKTQTASNYVKPSNKNQQSKNKQSYTSQNNEYANKQNSKQDKKKYESVNDDKYKQKRSRNEENQDDDESPKSKLKDKKSNLDTQQIKDRALKGFFDSHLQRPANRSLSGFKAIKQSLEKQKKQLKVNPARGKSPINSVNKSKFNASTVSKIQPNSIFAKPPNPNIRSKKYQGTFVLSNPQIESVLHDIQKEQGMKRLKISNLKSRALLYESEHIQVGYKSEAIYQNVEGLENVQQMIQLQLFIGNKSREDLRNFEVVFHGDQKSLIYSSPEKAPEIISAGDQCTFTVIVIPCVESYSMTMMRWSYAFKTQTFEASCILPSTVLKFASYQKADVRDMKQYERTQAVKCYQTQKFQLSHYFPPRKIAHYIEELNEMTSYSEFVENGSEKDFVLGAFVLIKNKYDGLVKINVRPDLSVVLQLMSNNQNREAQSEFQFYLQTLWMILKEHR